MSQFENFGFVYLLIFNLLAVFLTVYDKVAAIKGKWRISEKHLLATALLGGSPAMLVAMLIVRHKTKSPLFMIGLPLIIGLQIFVYLYYF